MKIAITTTSFATFDDAPLRLLKDNNLEYTINTKGRSLTEEESIELLQGCVAVAAGTEPLTRRLMDAVPTLRIISRCGSGIDTVDRVAAAEKGIIVCNTPDAPTIAVAELTLSYALNLMRSVSSMDRNMRNNVWKKRMGHLLQGKNVGIIGMGRIGKAVAQRFAAFGVQIAYYDPFVSQESIPHLTAMPLNELLPWANIISLHCTRPEQDKDLPQNTVDTFLLNAARLKTMRQGAWLINAARGGLVDEDALCTLLSSGHLAGAAVDTFCFEPYTGPLQALENVILTPHIGSYAQEARVQMEVETVQNIINLLK